MNIFKTYIKNLINLVKKNWIYFVFFLLNIKYPTRGSSRGSYETTRKEELGCCLFFKSELFEPYTISGDYTQILSKEIGVVNDHRVVLFDNQFHFSSQNNKIALHVCWHFRYIDFTNYKTEDACLPYKDHRIHSRASCKPGKPFHYLL